MISTCVRSGSTSRAARTREVHGRAPGHDGDGVASRHVRAAAEGQQPVGRGVRVAVVPLAIEVLVLEEQHRILVAERGAEEPDGVTGA